MSTPQERAIALELAVKATGTLRHTDEFIMGLARTFEEYISGPAAPDPATSDKETQRETTDGTPLIERRHPSASPQDVPLPIGDEDLRAPSCARCGAPHNRQHHVYDHEFETPKGDVQGPRPS